MANRILILGKTNLLNKIRKGFFFLFFFFLFFLKNENSLIHLSSLNHHPSLKNILGQVKEFGFRKTS